MPRWFKSQSAWMRNSPEKSSAPVPPMGTPTAAYGVGQPGLIASQGGERGVVTADE